MSHNVTDYVRSTNIISILQRQTAVTAYVTRKQLLLFVSAALSLQGKYVYGNITFFIWKWVI